MYLRFENPQTLSEAADNVVLSDIFKPSQVTGIGSSGGVYINELIRISDHKSGMRKDPSILDIGTHEQADIRLQKWSEINDMIPKLKRYCDSILDSDRWDVELDEDGFEYDFVSRKAILIKEIFG